MKRGYLLTALLFTAFMFPFFGNISNADALGNYGCGKKQGNITKKQHVNCLRRLLTSTPHGLTVPKGKNGLGKFGCGNKNRKKHVNCLRRLLDQHGPHYAKGGAGPTNATGMPPMGMPPMGMNPPMPPMGMPPMGMNPPMPPTGAQPVLPPTGGMPTAAMPPADPCMAVTDANDKAACVASHPAPGMGMPPTGMYPPTATAPMGMPATGMPMGDPCMIVPAGPDRAACYATTPRR